ncbi:ATP-binding cassette domain-containing protein [Kitasatospora aburaviensis]
MSLLYRANPRVDVPGEIARVQWIASILALPRHYRWIIPAAAALFEELLFRGAVLLGLGALGSGFGVALAVSTCLFAAGQVALVSTPVQAYVLGTSSVTLGVVGGLLTAATGGILPALALHMSFAGFYTHLSASAGARHHPQETEPVTVNQPSADPAEEEADAGAVVRVDRLTVTYGAFTAVRDVSFRIPPGEVFGLVGPNGAGKTSIVEAVGGLRRPARDGAISVCGHDPRTDREAVTRLVGMQLQESQFPSRARVGELCELYEAIYRAPGASAALLESFGLADRRRSLIADLSGGMRQRLALALAQIGDVRLVVLDELTTGLDPHQRRETWRSVLDLAARGVAVLLTSHAMDEVEALCDRVGVLRAGELVALDAPARLTEAHAARPPSRSTCAPPRTAAGGRPGDRATARLPRADPAARRAGPAGVRRDVPRRLRPHRPPPRGRRAPALRGEPPDADLRGRLPRPGRRHRAQGGGLRWRRCGRSCGSRRAGCCATSPRCSSRWPSRC